MSTMTTRSPSRVCTCSDRPTLRPATFDTVRRACVPSTLAQVRQDCSRISQSGRRGCSLTVRAERDKDENNSGPDSTESLFMKELQKRGLSTASRDEAGADRPSTSTSTRESQDRQDDRGGQPVPPPPRSGGQLDKSRKLGSEGFEGIVPRLTELGKLGLTFFLAFGPLILVTVGLFAGLYALFGDEFIHGGRSFNSIPYLDPNDLLDEPTVDPTVPFR